MRLIDADALNEAMYRKPFETDGGRQRLDGGLWIHYKVVAWMPMQEPYKEDEDGD